MNIRIGDYVTDGEVSGRVVAGPASGEFEIRLDVATPNRGWVWRHWKSLRKLKGGSTNALQDNKAGGGHLA